MIDQKSIKICNRSLIIIFIFTMSTGCNQLKVVSGYLFKQPDLNRHYLTAINNSQYRRVEILVAMGVEINCTTTQGYNGLHIAVLQDDELMVKYLLELGVNKDHYNGEGKTPVILAQEYNKTRLFIQLITDKTVKDIPDKKPTPIQDLMNKLKHKGSLFWTRLNSLLK